MHIADWSIPLRQLLRVPGESKDRDGVALQRARILFINTEEFLGPPMQVHTQLMRRLDPEKYSVFIATNSHGDSGDQFRTLSNAVTTEYSLGGTFSNIYGIRAKAKQFLTNFPVIFSFFKILREIRKQNIDAIHCASEPRALLLSFMLALACRRKLVVHAHVEHGNERFLKKVVISMGLRRANAIVAISEFVKQSIVNMGIPPDKVTAVLNVVDLERFNPRLDGSGIRAEFGINVDTPVISTVGRINKHKGQLELAKALVLVRQEFPDVKALIVGWPDPATMPSGKAYSEELREFCVSKGLADNVIIAEARPDIQNVFAAADLVVVPSVWNEPLGLVVMEAMATGKPVIGTMSGGIPEMIVDGTGFVVPRGSPQELADAILKLLRQPELRCELGRNAREWAERYFYESRLAEEVAKVYDRIMPLGVDHH